jgi:carboxymethylenebutenolidase
MCKTITISYDTDKKFNAYLAVPKAKGPLPALILIHEVWGVNDNIKGIAEQLRDEGYIVLAPNLLNGTGVIEKMSPRLFADLQNPAKRHQAQIEMRDALQPLLTPEFAEAALAKLKAAFKYLTIHSQCDGNIGAIGYCFGGTCAFQLAIHEPMLVAAVIYYGQPPRPIENVEKIKAPIMAFYGKKDQSLMAVLAELEQAMERYNKDFSSVVYPDAGHAFANSTNVATYDKAAAEDAWSKALDFLRRHLY